MTAPSQSDKSVALSTEHLTKAYGQVVALADFSFEVGRGEVIGLLGDNGAGKSTLVKCLSGIVAPDSGRILVDGEPVRMDDAQVARSLGIDTVFQDLALVGDLDVAANLFLNREKTSTNPILRALGWLDEDAMHVEAQAVLERLGINVPSVSTAVDRLSGGQRQAVAVGRAVAWGRHIVLMDEPAAALGVEQSRLILELIRALSSRGVAVVLITHNMEHVIEVCDRAVVLRHGVKVGDIRIAEVSSRDLIDLITGAAHARSHRRSMSTSDSRPNTNDREMSSDVPRDLQGAARLAGLELPLARAQRLAAFSAVYRAGFASLREIDLGGESPATTFRAVK